MERGSLFRGVTGAPPAGLPSSQPWRGLGSSAPTRCGATAVARQPATNSAARRGKHAPLSARLSAALHGCPDSCQN